MHFLVTYLLAGAALAVSFFGPLVLLPLVGWVAAEHGPGPGLLALGGVLLPCAEAKARGLAASAALNHRVSLSVYFHDPEGNLVEVYWATGRTDTDRPYADPLPLEALDRPEAELLALVGGPA